MPLDFTKLNNIALKSSKTPQKQLFSEEEGNFMSNDVNALIRPKKELLDNLDKVALAKLEKEKEEYSNTIEVYKRYQNNIKLSKGLLGEILQETKEGEDICNLFLKAVRCISYMTGDMLFYDQIENDIKAVYGEALLEKMPLEWELEEVEKRLSMITSALKRPLDPDVRQRIQRAREAHENKKSRLEKFVDKELNSLQKDMTA